MSAAMTSTSTSYKPSTSSDHVRAERPTRDSFECPTVALYFAEEFLKLEAKLASGSTCASAVSSTTVARKSARRSHVPTDRHQEHVANSLPADKTYLLYTSEAYLYLNE